MPRPLHPSTVARYVMPTSDCLCIGDYRATCQLTLEHPLRCVLSHLYRLGWYIGHRWRVAFVMLCGALCGVYLATSLPNDFINKNVNTLPYTAFTEASPLRGGVANVT